MSDRPESEPFTATSEASAIPAPLQRAADALRSLAQHEWSLFFGLLALNALALPYAGIEHDAVLYAFQVTNRIEDGRHDGDLYFRFGSQDRFTIFSPIVSPVARVLGVPLTFFLFYLAAKALFLLGLQRLVLALIDDRLVAVLALIYLVVTPIPFAGINVFNVSESFLTPRLIASAFVLLGLERLLHDRPGSAFALILVGLLFHPVMAFPGLVVWACSCLITYISRDLPVALLLLIALAGGVVLLTSLGTRLFGHMDANWNDAVRRAAFLNFPADWQFQDWLRIVVSLAILAGAIWALKGDECRRRFVGVVGMVALVGVIGGFVVCYLPYALLLQGQPYRALWLLEVVKVPLAFLLMAKGWASSRVDGRIMALALAVYLAVGRPGPGEVLIVLLPFPLFLVFWRGQKNRVWRAAISSVATGLLIREVIVGNNLIQAAFFQQGHWVGLDASPLDRLHQVLTALDPLVALLAGVALLLAGYRWLGTGRAFAVLSVGTYLMLQLAWFGVPLMPWYQEHCHGRDEDAAFVRTYLDTSWRDPQRPPTVYWPGPSSKTVWLSLGADSYFEWPNQTAGVMFSEGLATEAMRRAGVVKRLEIDRLHRRARLPGQAYWETEPYRGWMERLYEASMKPPDEGGEPRPTAADLEALCRDESVDFVILPEGFPGLYAATNGRWFIYDARELRP